MPLLTLPIRTSHTTLAKLLGTFEGDPDDERLVEVIVPPGLFITPAAIALLAAWSLKQIQRGFRFDFSGDDSALRYLARMDLQNSLDASGFEGFSRHPDAGRFIGVHMIETSTDCLKAMTAMGDMILHQFENARAFFPAMEWAAYEVMDNIHIHAESPCPGTVCAQYFPESNTVQIGICDMGRGIRASLSPRYPEETDTLAIAKALERGVTRDPAVGQGNGLAGTREIARANGGQFYLWSGSGCYRLKGGEEQVDAFPMTVGTGIHLSLDARRPVDLAQTFIGRDQLDPNESTYINSETEKACEAGLIVALECVHTGGRDPAAGLRRKVESLLDESGSKPVILDFTGISSASSSYLDELLGRLVTIKGAEFFSARVKVINLAPHITAMARVVINQRWQLSHPTPLKQGALSAAGLRISQQHTETDYNGVSPHQTSEH